MGRRLEFEKSVEGGLFTYRYLSERGPFERSWPGLYDDRWPSREPTPFSEWGVNNNNGEEFALYVALIWRLTDGLRRFVVPRYDRAAGMRAVGAPFALIGWEYEVEDMDTGEPGHVKGFVPARTSVPVAPEVGPWERENATRAGLFDVAAFWQLKEIARGLLMDASGELNLYALRKPPKRDIPVDAMLRGETIEPALDERGEPLAAALAAADAPKMSSLIEPGELFVDLTIGVDAGYFDVIVIHAVDEIDDRLGPLVDEYEGAIAAYEAEVDEIQSFEQWSDRLRELVGVGP